MRFRNSSGRIRRRPSNPPLADGGPCRAGMGPGHVRRCASQGRSACDRPVCSYFRGGRDPRRVGVAHPVAASGPAAAARSLPCSGVWLDWAGRLAHFALYGLLIAAPVAGVVLQFARGDALPLFGLSEIPSPWLADRAFAHSVKEVHEVLANGLVILASLHAAAALVHHWVFRDRTLMRMLPGSNAIIPSGAESRCVKMVAVTAASAWSRTLGFTARDCHLRNTAYVGDSHRALSSKSPDCNSARWADPGPARVDRWPR